MNNVQGGPCDTWREGAVYTGFWWGDLMEIDHSKDLGLE